MSQSPEEIRRRQMMQDALKRSLLQPKQVAGESPLAQALRNVPRVDVPKGFEDLAIGEDYGKSRPSLYRINENGGNVNINPLKGSSAPGGSSDPFSMSNPNVRNARLPWQQPQGQSFMPGESAGIPDSIRHRFPFLQNFPQPNAPSNSQPRSPVTVPSGNAGLSLPQPSSPNIDMAGTHPPQPNLPTPEPSTPRIGYSTQGLTGLDKLIQHRKALEEADPESKVTDSGEILPPEKTGRFRGMGTMAGLAAQQVDPDRPLFSLGQMLGGGITGLVSPRSAAKAQRRFDIGQLDNDVAQGLKLKTAQAELDRATNPIGQMSTRVVTEGEYPGIEAGTEIRVRVDPRTGSVIDVVGPNNRPVVSDMVKRAPQGAPHYESDADGNLIAIQGGRAQKVTGEDGQPIKVRSKNAAGEVVEVEVNGRTLKVTPGQALDYYGQIGAREDKRTAEDRERQSKHDAAKSEYDSLVTAEEEARKAKEDAYKTLDAMRKSNQPKEDVEQADQAAKAADAFYRTFGEKKKEAGRRMLENQPQAQSSQPYAGRTMSQANLAKYAKDKGLTIEAARAEVEGLGVKIQ